MQNSEICGNIPISKNRITKAVGFLTADITEIHQSAIKMAKDIEHRHFNTMTPHGNYLHISDSCGPQERNLYTWYMVEKVLGVGPKNLSRTNQKSYLKRKLKDHEWRRMVNVLNAMMMEYESMIDDDVAGAAIFDLLFMEVKVNNSISKTFLSSVLLLFNNGEVLFLRSNKDKKKIKAEWKDPVDDFELKEMKKEEDFAKIASSLHKSCYGAEVVSLSGYISIGQDKDRFTNNEISNPRDFCWTCDVSVAEAEKSLCKGCLVARYCSMEYQKGDWEVHGPWCEIKKKKMEERRCQEDLERMKERARRDIEEDNNVD
jgi:hypothetical protein